MHNYIYKIRLTGLSIQALRPNKHISLSTYKYLAHQPINIIKHHYNSTRAWPWGITIPSPYLCIVLSAYFLHNINNLSKILKKMWVFYPHSIFMLPSCVIKTVLGPLDLYKPYGSTSELFYFLVQNVYRMHLKSAFLLHLNHIPMNNMISIRYIFLKK
jgi:hypothetical protein